MLAALPVVAAALLGFVGHPTLQHASVRRFVPSGASVSSCTFRLPMACSAARLREARTPAVTAKVGGYASKPEDPIAPAPPPAPLVLDATTKKQLAIIVSTSFLVQMGVGMGIIVLPVFAQSLGLGQLGVRHTGLEPRGEQAGSQAGRRLTRVRPVLDRWACSSRCRR